MAGERKGMARDSNTRSGLLWEVERLLTEVENLPDVLLMENVPEVRRQANITDFMEWLKFLESKGYTNYIEDLNAKNYGVPQNRDRTFMVSLKGKYRYDFPNPFKLEKN